MKQHVKALAAVLVIGLLAVWGFKSFFLEKVQQTSTTISTLDNMKNVGVPSFVSSTITGESFDLNQFKGKVVILNFWASWCGPCVEEVPSLIKLAQNFKGEIKVIAISADSSVDEIKAFLKSFPDLAGENIKILHDQDRSKMKMYAISRLPESLILDRNHKLAKKISGSIDWVSQDSLAYIGSLTK